MTVAAYRDLPNDGLPLITPQDSLFQELVQEIRAQPTPFLPLPEEVPIGAVLLNQTGKSILSLTHVWRFTDPNGRVGTSQNGYPQLDRLLRGGNEQSDLLMSILPGSKRLITPRGVFGSNVDVKPELFANRGMIGGSGGGFNPRRPEQEAERVELLLDFVIFEDGLCIGPDESGILASVTRDLARQMELAREIAQTLRQGGTAGTVFEILRATAGRNRTGQPPMHMMANFARSAIHRMIDLPDSEILAWFESIAHATPLPLRRAG